MNIGFNVNRLGMIGLGVTLKSLLDNCSDSSKINIYILCSDLNIEDKSNIQKLLLKYSLNEIKLIDFDVNEHFGTFSSLQGDLTTYGRLLLQDYVKGDSVLYLDADLVVELDVLSLEGFDFQGKGIAAVDGGKMSAALDHPFLCNEIGLGMDLTVFNAGIILFNLKFWREQDIKNQCLAFGKKYETKLRSHDQTILNAFFAGNFAFLPLEFNMLWFAQNKRPEAKKVILHFVGSPKPWDVLGKYVHRGYAVWKSYLNADWEKAYYHYNQGEFLRTWHIRRSYARLLLLKMKSKN